MDFSDYQRRVPHTAKLDVRESRGRVELVLGLVTEVGSLAQVYKKHVRDGLPLEGQRETLKQEIGDVQWYIAMIAHSLDLDLSQIAEENLIRTHDRYERAFSTTAAQWIPPFETGYSDSEVFPRRMLFEITELECEKPDDLPHVHFAIIDAAPYVFGDIEREKVAKQIGFDLGDGLGDDVNDNSRRPDGYRFHDAVHVAFMAILGWSPVMRALLHIKRRTNQEVDRTEDGARARDLEEALSAILKEYSETRNHFMLESDIDGEVRDLIRRVVGNLEVKDAPIWLWVRAIHQGYIAMNGLIANRGGWILADLDSQTVTYSAERPQF